LGGLIVLVVCWSACLGWLAGLIVLVACLSACLLALVDLLVSLLWLVGWSNCFGWLIGLVWFGWLFGRSVNQVVWFISVVVKSIHVYIETQNVFKI
jgi:hypothetical protein